MSSDCIGNIRIHGSVAIGLGQYLASIGHDISALARGSRLTLGSMEDVGSRYISLPAYSVFLERLSVILDDPHFALNWNRDSSDGGMMPIALAARFAPSPVDALKIMSRFASIGLDLDHCTLTCRDDVACYSWGLSPLVVNPWQFNDRFAAIIVSRFKRGFGGKGVLPVKVQLARPAPHDVSVHRRDFGCPVEFGCDDNRIFYSMATMLEPNPLHDPEVFNALVELCERRLADSRKTGDFSSIVEEVVSKRISSADLNLDMVARDLGISTRVLQRRLAESGVSFQEIHDRVRRELASELLRNTGVPISEIAYRVGFSATGNFSRAAKRWFGLPPKQWRRLQV
ncbi:AraC family transcriptional regulator ligand-binding domain-containing protein [Roseibium sp.]|uniref:AraC family transcriptional regulator n=1 Tax=Roseibium sp. TaxID=1936156 RepID=UPI003A9886A3